AVLPPPRSSRARVYLTAGAAARHAHGRGPGRHRGGPAEHLAGRAFGTRLRAARRRAPGKAARAGDREATGQRAVRDERRLRERDSGDAGPALWAVGLRAPVPGAPDRGEPGARAARPRAPGVA